MTNDDLVPTRIDKTASSLMGAVLKTIDDGVGPLTGARDYAESRLELTGDNEAAIQRIVRETVATSGTAGFVTGVGGFVTMPVSLPANIAGQAILNARMVAAIAHLRGWDITDEFVRNSILITIAGGQPNQVLRQFGIQVGGKVAANAIKRIPIAVIRDINRRVGFMLLAKYGTKRSVVTLTKAVPAIGGLIGGAVDAGFTKAVSTGAKRAFPQAPSSGAPAAVLVDDH